MKNILAILLFLSFSFSASAQYIEGQENTTDTDMMVTTTMMEKICTMEYAPVCAEVQVQCIVAPCLPVTETFGNACSAGDNKILYTGECSEYVDTNKYNRYKKQESSLYPIIEKASTKILENAIVTLDASIENTKLLRIARWVQNERITTYTFLKHLLENVLKTRY